MLSNIQLRPVIEQDIQSLLKMCWDNRSQSAIQQLVTRAKYNEKYNRGIGIVATNQHDEALAFGQIIQWSDCGEISDLIVAPNYRSRGIGTAIIHQLIEYAKTQRFPRVEIGVSIDNPQALALYRRLNFKDQDTRTIKLGGKEELILYLNMPLI